MLGRRCRLLQLRKLWKEDKSGQANGKGSENQNGKESEMVSYLRRLSGDVLGAFGAGKESMVVFVEEIGGWVVRLKHSCALEVNRKGGNGMWGTCLPLARHPES